MACASHRVSGKITCLLCIKHLVQCGKFSVSTGCYHQHRHRYRRELTSISQPANQSINQSINLFRRKFLLNFFANVVTVIFLFPVSSLSFFSIYFFWYTFHIYAYWEFKSKRTAREVPFPSVNRGRSSFRLRRMVWKALE